MLEVISKEAVVKLIEMEGCGICAEEVKALNGFKLIRCMECKYYWHERNRCILSVGMVFTSPTAYCSYGEEEEDNNG